MWREWRRHGLLLVWGKQAHRHAASQGALTSTAISSSAIKGSSSHVGSEVGTKSGVEPEAIIEPIGTTRARRPDDIRIWGETLGSVSLNFCRCKWASGLVESLSGVTRVAPRHRLGATADCAGCGGVGKRVLVRGLAVPDGFGSGQGSGGERISYVCHATIVLAWPATLTRKRQSGTATVGLNWYRKTVECQVHAGRRHIGTRNTNRRDTAAIRLDEPCLGF